MSVFGGEGQTQGQFQKSLNSFLVLRWRLCGFRYFAWRP
jgi:hypothetical protein